MSRLAICSMTAASHTECLLLFQHPRRTERSLKNILTTDLDRDVEVLVLKTVRHQRCTDTCLLQWYFPFVIIKSYIAMWFCAKQGRCLEHS
eukprot:6257437-Amphidinium_carterae.1